MTKIDGMFSGADVDDENLPGPRADATPTPAAPAHTLPPTVSRRTFTLAETVIDAATNAQKRLRGVYPGAHGSLNSFIEAAIADYTHRLEHTYNDGQPFPDVEKVRRRKKRTVGQ
ncbi:hypothetical protein OMK68_19865 [Rhodococcus pyridinivorans]|uniref:hypothetical protein n=1 Tax=Rhodococcus TaxID=1827 RepID=UPI002226A436|nr:hypothetical protein [Rhodococcus pyridinivorans]MCW3471864.1 hypothetical protein [Rhodococcus pyridinivorans]